MINVRTGMDGGFFEKWIKLSMILLVALSSTACEKCERGLYDKRASIKNESTNVVYYNQAFRSVCTNVAICDKHNVTFDGKLEELLPQEENSYNIKPCWEDFQGATVIFFDDTVELDNDGYCLNCDSILDAGAELKRVFVDYEYLTSVNWQISYP